MKLAIFFILFSAQAFAVTCKVRGYHFKMSSPGHVDTYKVETEWFNIDENKTADPAGYFTPLQNLIESGSVIGTVHYGTSGVQKHEMTGTPVIGITWQVTTNAKPAASGASGLRFSLDSSTVEGGAVELSADGELTLHLVCRK